LKSGDFSQNFVIAGLESAEGPAHGSTGRGFVPSVIIFTR
jgi:hypothetical protein